ncbi:hypothetical protein Tco_1159422 [Tanacetum coccineum]
MDSHPSQPSAPTLVVAKMHKEDPQAAIDPTSSRVTREEGADPQLRHDASADFTAEADPRNFAPNESISS